MIERAPDVTRLIDRLEDQGLVERDRLLEDRRMSISRITRKGLKLLEEMQPAMTESNARFAERLSAAEFRNLSKLLEKLYGG